MKTTVSILVFCLVSFLFFSGCVTFEEKKTMALTIDIPGGEVQLSGNPIWINTTTDRTAVTNQRMLLRIACTDQSIPGGPWIDSIPGVAARFNIQAIVDAPFNYAFDTELIEYITYYDPTAANITVEVGESYIDGNGDYQTDWSETPTDMVILKGKLSDHELAVLSNATSSFYDKYINPPMFLTQRFNESAQTMRVANIDYNVKMWMYFIGESQQQLSCIVNFSDGSTSGKQFEAPDLISDYLYELNLDIMARNICADNPGLIPMSYLVQFGSDVCNVEIENTYYDNHEEILVKNNLGGIEIIHCNGEFAEAKTTERETYVKTPAYTPDLLSGSIISVSKNNRNTYKVNTGFKTLHERRWIADLLTSDIAWWKSERLLHIDGETFGIAPVIIIPGTYQIDVTTNDLMSIEFEFELAQ